MGNTFLLDNILPTRRNIMKCTDPSLFIYDTSLSDLRYLGKYVDYPYRKILGDPSKILLPCGKCDWCIKQRSYEWSIRMTLDSMSVYNNFFITLTYENAPPALSVLDFENYIRRLKYYLGSFSYFACGEYGEENGRPHYHVCIFGNFGLLYDTTTRDIIRTQWHHGFVDISPFTIASANYVANYLVKSVRDEQELLYGVPPFIKISNKPAVGSFYYENHKKQILELDKIYVSGIETLTPIPRYYLKRLSKDFPEQFAEKSIRNRIQVASDAMEKKAEYLHYLETITPSISKPKKKRRL